MSNISNTFVLASVAFLAIALAANDAVSQEQSDQSPSSQSDEQNQSNPSDQQQSKQKEQQQRQEQPRQQQDEPQRQPSQDRSQSSSRDSASSREGQWSQPDGREYDNDSLRVPGNQSLEREEQRGDRSQQAGLGVALRSDGGEGVVVSQVHSGSPADEMGIRPGDRITQVNGRQVQSVRQFIASIRNMDPGQHIELDIRRARGGEQTVRGELESRREALTESDRQFRSFEGSGPRLTWDYRQQGRDNQQTRYEEQRGNTQDRGSQISGSRLDQIERQVDRLSRELDGLRVALQSIRRQEGQPTDPNRERTARYEEYQDSADERWDGRETYRQADRDRDANFGRDDSRYRRGNESRDRFDDDSSGGETGEDRLHVGSEDARE
jgi:hypothetical protein